ncbi:hypothetical protein RHS02_07841, partial [Rhizoctonia solani]
MTSRASTKQSPYEHPASSSSKASTRSHRECERECEDPRSSQRCIIDPHLFQMSKSVMASPTRKDDALVSRPSLGYAPHTTSSSAQHDLGRQHHLDFRRIRREKTCILWILKPLSGENLNLPESNLPEAGPTQQHLFTTGLFSSSEGVKFMYTLTLHTFSTP